MNAYTDVWIMRKTQPLTDKDRSKNDPASGG